MERPCDDATRATLMLACETLGGGGDRCAATGGAAAASHAGGERPAWPPADNPPCVAGRPTVDPPAVDASAEAWLWWSVLASLDGQ